MTLIPHASTATDRSAAKRLNLRFIEPPSRRYAGRAPLPLAATAVRFPPRGRESTREQGKMPMTRLLSRERLGAGRRRGSAERLRLRRLNPLAPPQVQLHPYEDPRDREDAPQ